MKHLLAAALLAAGLTACASGPATDPQSSLEHYFRACRKKDWKAAIKVVPPHMADTRREQVGEAMLDEFDDLTDFDWKIGRVAETSDRAIIDVKVTESRKNQRTYKVHTSTDDESYSLRKIEGLWYVIPLGMERVPVL